MNITLIGQAVGLFAVTNIDDIFILALFFDQAIGRNDVLRVVLRQYLGFAASILGVLGASLLPETAIPYLGLLPLILGLRAAQHFHARETWGPANRRWQGAGDGVAGPSAIVVP